MQVIRCIFVCLVTSLFLPTICYASNAVRWRVEFSYSYPICAWITDDVIYLRMQWGAGYENQQFPPTKGIENLAYDGTEGIPTDAMIVAIETSTGKHLWSRPYYGEFEFTLDPLGRGLWGFAPGFYRFDPKTGKTTEYVEFKPINPDERQPGDSNFESWRRIDGVRISGKIALATSDRFGTGMKDPIRIYDMDAREIMRVVALSPVTTNRLRKIDVVTSNRQQSEVSLMPVAGGKPIWTWKAEEPIGQNPALLDNDDVLVVFKGTGSVTRLKADDGSVVWMTRLPRGAYDPHAQIRRTNYYVDDTWPAAGVLDDEALYAIDAGGTIHLLDPKTGAIIGATRFAETYLCAPKRVGEQLIIVGDERAASVPLEIVKGKRPDDLDSRALEIKRKVEQKDIDGAMEVARDLTFESDLKPEAWQAMSLAAQAAGNLPLATRAEIRSIELTGAPTTPFLKESFGLLARVPTGPIRAPTAAIGFNLYAASTDGMLYVTDLQTAALSETREMGGPASAVSWEDGKLYRQTEKRSELILATTGAPEIPVRRDPLFSQHAYEKIISFGIDRDLPKEWFTIRDGCGTTIKHNDRYFRSFKGGRVAEVVGNQIVMHPAVLDGINCFNFFKTTDGSDLLAADSNSVFVMDENFRPANRLIDLRYPPIDNGPPEICDVNADENSIAMIVRHPEERLCVDLYTRDGKTRLRREVIGVQMSNEWNEQTRLTKVGDGYLYVGGDICWIPLDPARPVWRFAPEKPTEDIPGPIRNGYLDWRFGTPRIVDGKLFVAMHRGGIFVFDLDRITAAK